MKAFTEDCLRTCEKKPVGSIAFKEKQNEVEEQSTENNQSLAYTRETDQYIWNGRPEAARRAYDVARQLLEDKLRSQPDDDRYYGSLGAAYAGLGRRKEAVEAGKKGMALCPPKKEAWRATFRMTDMARIYVMLGEPGEAIKLLDDLLSVPGEICAYALQNDPTWAPLKTSAGFQDLIRKHSR